jgi:hypothetical protein
MLYLNFILSETCKPVSFFAFFNLRNLLYLIFQDGLCHYHRHQHHYGHFRRVAECGQQCSGNTSIDISSVTANLQMRLMAMDLGPLFALGFQGFLIIVCVAIYAVLVKSISAARTSAKQSGLACGVHGAAVLYAF